jgi:hypothetical protein
MSQTRPHRGIDIRQCEHLEAVELEAGTWPGGLTSSVLPVSPTHYLLDDSPDISQHMSPQHKSYHLENSIFSKYVELVEKKDKHLFGSLATAIDKVVVFVCPSISDSPFTITDFYLKIIGWLVFRLSRSVNFCVDPGSQASSAGRLHILPR